MRIKILGAGPAGLYLAYLMKKRFPNYKIEVCEQNPRDVTFGFGVVLSGRAMSFLSEGDRDLVERLASITQTWSDQHLVHRGQKIVVDGSSFSGIPRIAMLQILQDACASLGVEVSYGIRQTAELANSCDVLVSADGANSSVRDAFPEAFGTRVIDLENYFAWYGVATAYEAHTLTFIESEGGVFCGHHYRYKPEMSTFVVEVDSRTFETAGMHLMDNEQRRHLSERVFTSTLGHRPLIDNKSNWRRWRLVKNERWSYRNIVLIGDALRTAHPSIGSGTRLAMEDSIALARAFEAHGADVPAVFKTYETARKPSREKLNRAAELSIAWYENMAAKMALSPYDLAYDYMLRTGIMTTERLERDTPLFMKNYRAFKDSSAS